VHDAFDLNANALLLRLSVICLAKLHGTEMFTLTLRKLARKKKEKEKEGKK